MLKSLMDFARYFITYENYLILSALKFAFQVQPAPLDPTPQTTPAPESSYVLHDLWLLRK